MVETLTSLWAKYETQTAREGHRGRVSGRNATNHPLLVPIALLYTLFRRKLQQYCNLLTNQPPKPQTPPERLYPTSPNFFSIRPRQIKQGGSRYLKHSLNNSNTMAVEITPAPAKK
jgi:hypothetical protein